MKVILDENVVRQIAEQLRQDGYERFFLSRPYLSASTSSRKNDPAECHYFLSANFNPA
jgi:hypothetical protein